MEAVASPENIEVFLGLVLEAIRSGQWALVAALLLVVAVFLVRKTVKAPFLATPEGGALLNLAGSFASGLVLAFTGTPFSWALVWTVLLSVMASGGRSLIKSLLPLLLRIPFLAQAFGRGSAAEVEDAAKKAGIAAAVGARAPKSEDIVNGP